MKILSTQNLLIALIGSLLPMSAWAAGTSFFMKGFYHPTMVPAHLLSLFALALLMGQQGWRNSRIVLPLFLFVLIASLAMTRYQTASWNAELILLPLAAVTGILVIFKWDLSVIVPSIIAIIAAIVIGMDSSVPRIPGLQIAKIYSHLAGSAVFGISLLLVIGLIALGLRNVLDGVILRILGAWSTAGAVLVVTLLLVGDLNP